MRDLVLGIEARNELHEAVLQICGAVSWAQTSGTQQTLCLQFLRLKLNKLGHQNQRVLRSHGANLLLELLKPALLVAQLAQRILLLLHVLHVLLQDSIVGRRHSSLLQRLERTGAARVRKSATGAR